VIAEVELASPQQAVVVPSWCVQEITGQGRYSNAALAASPLAAWPAAERCALLALLSG
jgi:CYTH domain-containing protein